MKHILFIIYFFNLFVFSLQANDSSKGIYFSSQEIDYIRNKKEIKISFSSSKLNNDDFVVKKLSPAFQEVDKNNNYYLSSLFFILSLAFLYLLYKQNKLKKENLSLQEESLEFNNIFNSSMEGIFIFENGRCINLNNIAVELLGYDNKDDLIGVSVEDLISYDFTTLVKRNIKTNYTKMYECEGIKKDGTLFPILIKGETFKLRHKTFRVSCVLDLTDIKNKDKLLVQKVKMVALGEMLGNISHQWKQPLSTISTAASGVMLQKDMSTLEDKFFYEAMNAILNNVNYLSKTIDVFTNFIKEDKKRTRFNIIRNIDNTISIISAVLKMNKVNIVFEVKDTFYLHNYENEFSEAIMNILNNSKDALISSSVKTRYIFINIYKEDEKFIIEIKDNAGGINIPQINKIFEPYFTTKRKSQGSGLGLYIVNKIIVESMNGSIFVKNVKYEYNNIVYKGAMFKLTL